MTLQGIYRLGVSPTYLGGLSIRNNTVFECLLNDAHTSAPTNGSMKGNVYEGAL